MLKVIPISPAPEPKFQPQSLLADLKHLIIASHQRSIINRSLKLWNPKKNELTDAENINDMTPHNKTRRDQQNGN